MFSFSVTDTESNPQELLSRNIFSYQNCVIVMINH